MNKSFESSSTDHAWLMISFGSQFRMLGVIDFSVAFDCWKEWCEFFGPITERIKAKPSISDYFRRTIEICSLVIGDGRNLSVHLI